MKIINKYEKLMNKITNKNKVLLTESYYTTIILDIEDCTGMSEKNRKKIR